MVGPGRVVEGDGMFLIGKHKLLVGCCIGLKIWLVLDHGTATEA